MKFSFLIFIIYLLCSGTAIVAQPTIPIESVRTWYSATTEQYFPPKKSRLDGNWIIGIYQNGFAGYEGNLDSLALPQNIGKYHTTFLKYDAVFSNIDWHRSILSTVYDSSTIINLFPQPDGGNILCGTNNSGSFYIAKEDNQGNRIWKIRHSPKVGHRYLDAIQSYDGMSYYISATCYLTDTNAPVHYGSAMSDDGLIIKIDSLGNKLWSKVIGGSQEEIITKIIAFNGGIYVLGKTNSNDYDFIGNHGDSDIFLMKISDDGQIIWSKLFGGTNFDSGLTLFLADQKDGLYIGGATYSGDGDVNGFVSLGNNTRYNWVLRVDSSGQLLWNNCYGGSNVRCSLYDMAQTPDGNLWLVNEVQEGGNHGSQLFGFKGGIDVGVIKLDSNGKYLGTRVLGSSNSDAMPKVLALPNNKVVVLGIFFKADLDFSGVNNLTNVSTGKNGDAFMALLSDQISGIEETKSKDDIVSVYPNPAYTQLNIGAKRSGKIIILDLLGHEVYSKAFKSNTAMVINVVDWAEGTYIYQYRTNGIVYKGKFQIIHN